MTQSSPFTSINQQGDRLEIVKRNNQFMIVKVWDYPEYVRTPHNKDGMVYPKDGEPFPNRAIRATVVDLGERGADGLPGKLYQETWFQAFSMMKVMKGWVGQLKLISWLQDQEPRDPHGNPKQTNPYAITDHTGNPEAMALAMDYLARHPEFHDLPAPAPYDGKPPAPAAPQAQQDPWAPGPYGGPPQQPYYGQQQPGYYGQQPPQQQWQPPVPPAQPPSQWNTAAPPPEYYTQQPQWAQQQQQQGPPPGYNAPQIQQYMNQLPPQPDPGYGWQGQGQQMQQPPQQPYSAPPAQQGPPQQPWQQPQPQQAPQGQPGSFFAASQGQPTPQVPQQYQGPGFNPQSDSPPF